MKALEAFYHHIARSITGKTDWIIIERGWEPPTEGRGHRGGGAVASAVICTEVTGNHCGVHVETPDIRVVYWGRADYGF